jgi:hypothetical protein
VRHLRVCVSVCVCARAHAPAYVHMYTTHTHSLIQSHLRWCVRFLDDKTLLQGRLYCKDSTFSVCCAHLAVLGAGGGLVSSAHEWLLQRLADFIAQRGIALARCL